MIDTAYNATKDALSVIFKWKKEKDKKAYIEMIEKKYHKLALKYDELMEEYKKELEKNNDTIPFEKEYYEVLQYAKENPTVKALYKLCQDNGIEYEIALAFLEEHGYIVTNFQQVRFYLSDGFKKNKILKFIKDYSEQNKE